MIEFWVLAVILVVSAVWTIAASKPVYSVVALLLNFAVLAAMYLTLNAEFLAVIQLIVYSGAILILFLFVIALLSSGTKPFEPGPNRMPRVLVPAVMHWFGPANWWLPRWLDRRLPHLAIESPAPEQSGRAPRSTLV